MPSDKEILEKKLHRHHAANFWCANLQLNLKTMRHSSIKLGISVKLLEQVFTIILSSNKWHWKFFIMTNSYKFNKLFTVASIILHFGKKSFYSEKIFWKTLVYAFLIVYNPNHWRFSKSFVLYEKLIFETSKFVFRNFFHYPHPCHVYNLALLPPCTKSSKVWTTFWIAT